MTDLAESDLGSLRMALSARTISSMKWRTTFVALSLLAFFTYGPQLRKERERNWEQFGEYCIDLFYKNLSRGLMSSMDKKHILKKKSGESVQLKTFAPGPSCIFPPKKTCLLKTVLFLIHPFL